MFLLFAFVLIAFYLQTFNLQIDDYRKYQALALNNTVKSKKIIAKRGVIKDRSGKILAGAGNEFYIGKNNEYKLYKRTYPYSQYTAHLLGYIRYPKTDKKGYLWRDKYEGVMGVEKSFDTLLSGENGEFLEEKDARFNSKLTHKIKKAKDGQNLILSIDIDLQKALHDTLLDGMKKSGFKGASGAILDVKTGEVLALVNIPSFDPNKIMNDIEYMKSVSKDGTILLNRATQGLYTPGSIVKPFVALSALKEGIISPDKKIVSTGALKIKSPYSDKYFIFRDWKTHGPVNMKEAIAYSSNEYFYQVGGGYKEQKGLGIERLYKYARLFGFGEKTGIELPESNGQIPNPKWKLETFGEDWMLGDTYHTAIGQYGFLMTPVQALRYVASIANYGQLLTPTIVKGKKGPVSKLPFSKAEFNVIHDGMRLAVLKGTAKALNIKGLEIAAKTGTAQLGKNNEFMNSWVVGFWSYKEPRFAFVAVLEKGKAGTSFGAAPTMRSFFEWLLQRKSEYVR